MRYSTNRASIPSLNLIFYSEFFHKKKCFHTNQLNSEEEEAEKAFNIVTSSIHCNLRLLSISIQLNVAKKRTGKEETQRDNYGFKVLNSRYILASVVALILNENLCYVFMQAYFMVALCWFEKS